MDRVGCLGGGELLQLTDEREMKVSLIFKSVAHLKKPFKPPKYIYIDPVYYLNDQNTQLNEPSKHLTGC